MTILSIDPGVNTGIIIYDSIKKEIVFNTVFKFVHFKNTAQRLYFYAHAIKDLLHNFKNIDLVLIEDTAFWETSETSRVCATSGGLILLSKISGVIEYLIEKNNLELLYIKPLQWKGQLPHKIVVERNENFFSIKTKNPHLHSCFGMLKWFLNGEGKKNGDHNKNKTKKIITKKKKFCT